MVNEEEDCFRGPVPEMLMSVSNFGQKYNLRQKMEANKNIYFHCLFHKPEGSSEFKLDIGYAVLCILRAQLIICHSRC
jgi:hypothetical protein